MSNEHVHLSDMFKFVQGFGQKGHQIGRKIGDALELITLGMVSRCPALKRYMVIENGVEGATTARHKVEFAFYCLDALDSPIPEPDHLFGIVECKKVGVEVTIQNSFKLWLKDQAGRPFYATDGYSFNQRPRDGESRTICVRGNQGEAVLKVSVDADETTFPVKAGDKILFVADVEGGFWLLGPDKNLIEVEKSVRKCLILTVKKVSRDGVEELILEECLTGPQTPEKAKQASFVSLDVRKRVLGSFDKIPGRDDFISILVIGEASHWEDKSRAMVRLCNDYNLTVPDSVLITFFTKMLEAFGERYQDKMSKSQYLASPEIQRLVEELIQRCEGRVLYDMDKGEFIAFDCDTGGNRPKLKVIPI